MHRFIGIVAFGLGGLCASLVLMTPNRGRLPAEGFGGSQVHVLYDSPAATATVGVLVAVLIASLVVHLKALVTAVAIGLGAIVAFALLGGSALGTQYGATVAAGLVLGGLARLSDVGAPVEHRTPWPATALAVGSITGILFDHALRDARFPEVEPRRYADYLPSRTQSYLTGPSDWFVAAIAVVALVAITVLFARRAVTANTQPMSLIATIGGCVLPVASLGAYWWLRESVFTDSGLGLNTWVFGYLLLVAALVLALVLPGRSGLLWVAIVAVISTNAVSSSVGDGWVVVLIAFAMTVVGVTAGYFVHQPLWGIVLLGICTATALVGDSSESAVLIALLFVVPAAAAFTVIAALPSTGTVTASALGIPSVLVVSVGVEYGWTAYTPLTDGGSFGGIDIFTVSSTTTLTLSMISLLAAGVVALMITRRVPPGHEIGHP